MDKQKHTPAESAHRELINLFFAMSPEQKIEYMKSVFAHKAELLQRVAELTKENEEMMQAITKQDVIHGNDVAELSKLHKEFTELAIKFEDKNFELSRLREREKEFPELLQQVAELTKEVDSWKKEHAEIVDDAGERLKERDGQIKALTEQVEKYNTEMHLANVNKSIVEAENSRLREREKELVEALREFCQAVRKSDEKYPDWVGTTEVYGALFKSESLLSKFEVPNV